MPNCILCGAEGVEIEGSPAVWSHPDRDDCTVPFVDAHGVALDKFPAEAPRESLLDFALGAQTHTPVRVALPLAFNDQGYAYPGGASTGRGWSSVSTFQRCPYLWARKYVEGVVDASPYESPALAFGSLIHAFLAVYYTRQQDDSYTLDLTQLRDDLIRRGVDSSTVLGAFSLFDSYKLTYPDDNWDVLAVEYDLKDPRSNDSCRFDLIAYLPEAIGDRPAGTWIVEHKTASRFDKATIEGWVNDGEVIGQQALWSSLGLHHRFGPLQGTIVNILGKQKTPQFHRQVVPVVDGNIASHRDDLRRWAGLIQLAKSTGCFPRSRTSCVNRWGLCSEWDHCAGGGVL